MLLEPAPERGSHKHGRAAITRTSATVIPFSSGDLSFQPTLTQSMSFFFFLLVCTLLFFNRHLYLRNLSLQAQLSVYRRRHERSVSIPEWFRRLAVWISRISHCWKEVCLIVQPAAVLDWHRRRYKDFWTLKVAAGIRNMGRPPIDEDTISFIQRMNRENSLWTARRIQGELYRSAGIRLHLDTIRKYMVRRTPDPLRALKWKQFLKLHLPEIAAMDFFIIPRVGRNPLIGFFVIAHERPKLLHINVTSSPTGEWLRDQLMLALGTSANLQYILSDNDQLYRTVRQFINQVLSLNSVTTQLASPWQNGIAERFVRTLREDLLNCIIPHSESLVRARLQEYLRHYNEDRTHSSIDLDSPDGREDAHGCANVCGATEGESRRAKNDRSSENPFRIQGERPDAHGGANVGGDRTSGADGTEDTPWRMLHDPMTFSRVQFAKISARSITLLICHNANELQLDCSTLLQPNSSIRSNSKLLRGYSIPYSPPSILPGAVLLLPEPLSDPELPGLLRESTSPLPELPGVWPEPSSIASELPSVLPGSIPSSFICFCFASLLSLSSMASRSSVRQPQFNER